MGAVSPLSAAACAALSGSEKRCSRAQRWFSTIRWTASARDAMPLPGSRRPAALSRPSAAAVPGVVSKVTSASPLMFRQSRLLAWRDILAACGMCGVCCHRKIWPSARAAPAAGQRAAPGAETARARVPHAQSKKGRQLRVCAQQRGSHPSLGAYSSLCQLLNCAAS